MREIQLAHTFDIFMARSAAYMAATIGGFVLWYLGCCSIVFVLPLPKVQTCAHQAALA